jgi:hypothetical protein
VVESANGDCTNCSFFERAECIGDPGIVCWSGATQYIFIERAKQDTLETPGGKLPYGGAK